MTFLNSTQNYCENDRKKLTEMIIVIMKIFGIQGCAMNPVSLILINFNIFCLLFN